MNGQRRHLKPVALAVRSLSTVSLHAQEQRLDEARKRRERRRIAELAAAMEHQDTRRRKGICKVNDPATEPRAAGGALALWVGRP